MKYPFLFSLASLESPSWPASAETVVKILHICPVPEVLEITFANRSRYSFVAADEMFPGALDAPNYPYLPDIHLGKFAY